MTLPALLPDPDPLPPGTIVIAYGGERGVVVKCDGFYVTYRRLQPGTNTPIPMYRLSRRLRSTLRVEQK